EDVRDAVRVARYEIGGVAREHDEAAVRRQTAAAAVVFTGVRDVLRDAARGAPRRRCLCGPEKYEAIRHREAPVSDDETRMDGDVAATRHIRGAAAGDVKGMEDRVVDVAVAVQVGTGRAAQDLRLEKRDRLILGGERGEAKRRLLHSR